MGTTNDLRKLVRPRALPFNDGFRSLRYNRQCNFEFR